MEIECWILLYMTQTALEKEVAKQVGDFFIKKKNLIDFFFITGQSWKIILYFYKTKTIYNLDYWGKLAGY